MQILKDEIRDVILNNAKELFLKNGFEKTSMVAIAKCSGVSKSNIYNYFKSKDQIYAILTISIRSKLKEFSAIFSSNEFNHPFGSEGFNLELSCNIYNYILKNKEDFLLLMNSSHNTPYESIKESIIMEMSTHFKNSISSKKNDYDYYVIEIIARNLLEGFIYIALNRERRKDIETDLFLLIKYHIEGIRSLIKDSE